MKSLEYPQVMKDKALTDITVYFAALKNIKSI